MDTQLLVLTQQFSDVFQQYRDKCRQQLIENALGPGANLGSREFRILQYLDGKDRVSFKEVANALEVAAVLASGPEPESSRPRVSQAVSALWKNHKLVNKETNPADERQPLISLTSKGQSLTRQLNVLSENLVTIAMEAMALTAEEEQVLLDVYSRGLQKFRDKIQKEPTILL